MPVPRQNLRKDGQKPSFLWIRSGCSDVTGSHRESVLLALPATLTHNHHKSAAVRKSGPSPLPALPLASFSHLLLLTHTHTAFSAFPFNSDCGAEASNERSTHSAH